MSLPDSVSNAISLSAEQEQAIVIHAGGEQHRGVAAWGRDDGTVVIDGWRIVGYPINPQRESYRLLIPWGAITAVEWLEEWLEELP